MSRSLCLVNAVGTSKATHVKPKLQRCTNAPIKPNTCPLVLSCRPQNNGKFCPGSGRFNQLCNTRPCPPNAVDFRAQQCAEYNSKPFRGWYYKWKPYTKVDGKFEFSKQKFSMDGAQLFYGPRSTKCQPLYLCMSDVLFTPRMHPPPSRVPHCKGKTDGLYSFCKDIISPENKQYIPWIKMTSQGFLGIDGTRKETTLFRAGRALNTGKIIFSYLCRCYTFCNLIQFHFYLLQKSSFYSQLQRLGTKTWRKPLLCVICMGDV